MKLLVLVMIFDADVVGWMCLLGCCRKFRRWWNFPAHEAFCTALNECQVFSKYHLNIDVADDAHVVLTDCCEK